MRSRVFEATSGEEFKTGSFKCNDGHREKFIEDMSYLIHPDTMKYYSLEHIATLFKLWQQHWKAEECDDARREGMRKGSTFILSLPEPKAYEPPKAQVYDFFTRRVV